MNWHLIYSILNIFGWVVIAIMLCNTGIKTKSYNLNVSKVTTLKIVFFTIGAGLFSVLINGLPDLGLSITSFIYANSVSVILLFYQRIKIKKVYIPKLSKRNIEVGSIVNV